MRPNGSRIPEIDDTPPFFFRLPNHTIHLRFLCLLMAVTVFFTGCLNSSSAGESEPAETSARVSIAVPFLQSPESGYGGYANGVLLAQSHIDKMEGPVRVTLLLDNDQDDLALAMDLAQSYCDTPEVIGVVGHLNEDICATTAAYYGQMGKTLIVPAMSSEVLVPSGSVFRNLPGDSQVARALCQQVLADGCARAVLFYGGSAANFAMAGKVEQHALDGGLALSDRASEPLVPQELSALKRRWDAIGYDSVICAGSLEDAATLAAYLRENGYSGQVYCGDLMSTGPVPEGVTLLSLLPDTVSTGEMETFYQAYLSRFGLEPDIWAMQAYNSVMLLARAIIDNDIRTSAALTQYLASGKDIEGIFGTTSFLNNQITGRTLSLKVG